MSSHLRLMKVEIILTLFVASLWEQCFGNGFIYIYTHTHTHIYVYIFIYTHTHVYIVYTQLLHF